MARRRLHAFVTGRVQGVAFRAYTAREGRRLGLSGWVRNLPDGRVEVTAEGEADGLEGLLSFVRRGPPAARVADVEASWLPASDDLADFHVA